MLKRCAECCTPYQSVYRLVVCLIVFLNGDTPTRCHAANTGGKVFEERLELNVVESGSMCARTCVRVCADVPATTVLGRVDLRAGYTYRLHTPSEWFTFNATTGDILTLRAIDREAINSDHVDMVIVGQRPAYFINVRINIIDVNDNSPVFPQSVQNVSMSRCFLCGGAGR
jgi:hypothetical protein